MVNPQFMAAALIVKTPLNLFGSTCFIFDLPKVRISRKSLHDFYQGLRGLNVGRPETEDRCGLQFRKNKCKSLNFVEYGMLNIDYCLLNIPHSMLS